MRTSAGTASQGLRGDESVKGAAGVGWGGGVRASAGAAWQPLWAGHSEHLT